MINPCKTPFENGPGLCSVCKCITNVPGLRRCSTLIADSPAMRTLMVRAAPIAASDAPIIIRGESGTGKEVLARALHANSPRSTRPFLAVNVAALPSELLESELFGHARGAFTGAASAKKGLFEAAEGGTLLLDEVAEMPLLLQAKLLRALQDGEVRRVGDVRAFSVDVRIFCATHQDLRAAIEQGKFREDLYYRLSVFNLLVPPLRERVEDILPLACMFLEQRTHATGRFTAGARRALESWAWPGNVRELQNAVTHGAVLSGKQDVDSVHLPEEMLNPPRISNSQGSVRTLAQVEREHIRHVLELSGGRQIDAARILGISRTTLWRKLKELGIEVNE